MHRRGLYTALILTIISSLLIAWLLLPNPADVALMYFLDRRYEAAVIRYEKLYQEGSRSQEVVIPLAQSYLEIANEEKAIKLLEEYVEQNPQSIVASQFLAEQYVDTSRIHDFLKLADKVQVNKELREIEMSLTKSIERDRKKEIQYLEGEPLQEEETLRLINLYIEDGDREKAKVTLQTFFEKFPQSSLKNPALIIGSLLNIGLAEESYTFSRQYHRIHPNLAVEVDGALHFQKMGQEELANRYLHVLEQEYPNYPAVLAAKNALLIANENYFLAFEQMKRQYILGLLEEKQIPEFFDLSVSYRDDQMIAFLLSEDDLIADDRLEIKAKELLKSGDYHLLNYFPEHLSYTLLRNLLESLDDQSLTKQELFTLHTYYLDHPFSEIERLLLAEAYISKQFYPLAATHIEQVETVNIELLRLAILNGMIDTANQWMQEFAEDQEIQLLFNAAIGRWDLTNVNLNESVVYDLLLLAEQQKKSEMKLRLATWLYLQKGSDENRMLFIYALIGNGMSDQAFQMIGEGRPLKEKESRDIGYLLIESGEKRRAETLFFPLAKSAAFKSGDVQTLLSLWGETLLPSQLQWVESRAMTDQQKEKAAWLEYLLNLEYTSSVIPLVGRVDLGEDKIADVYLRALIEEEMDDEAERTLAYLIPEEMRLPRLKKFGRLSLEIEKSAISRKIYQKILAIEPSDKESIRELAFLEFARGNYLVAGPYFRFLIECGIQEDRIFFSFAEILRFENRYPEAKKFYRLALAASKEQNSLRAEIYARLNCYHQAVILLFWLIDENPKETYLKTLLANLLMDRDYYQTARAVLDQALQDDQEIILAYTRLYREEGCPILAFQKLQTVKTCDEDYFSALSLIQQEAFCPRKAARSLCQARQIAPFDIPLSRDLFDLLYLEGPYASLEYEWRKTEDQQLENFIRIHYSRALAPFTQVGVHLDQDILDVKEIGNPTTGQIQSFNGTRTRSELYLRHDFWNGREVRGSLYYQTGILGAGLQMITPDLFGKTLFVIEYHRPDWSFTETTVHIGSRDLLGLGRLIKFNPYFVVQLNGSINDYHLKGVDHAASTWATTVDATYLLPKCFCLGRLLGERGYISFNYNLDAEYQMSEKGRVDLFDNLFKPLNVTSRELHSGTIFARRRSSKHTICEGYWGYIYDRTLGGKMKPIYGVTTYFGAPLRTQLIFRYTHSASSDTSGSLVDSLRVELRSPT